MAGRLSEQDLARLAATQDHRCLGCGEWMADGVWTPHGSCRPYYGCGKRVRYDLFLAMVERSTNDGPIFDTWASAEPFAGVPSWFAKSERNSMDRYRDSHGLGCECGRCFPALVELAGYLVPEEVNR
jgi:hypothetical protein